MTKLSIVCPAEHIQPGQLLSWTAHWQFEESTSRKFTASLGWTTHGKGDEDWETACEHEWASMEASGKEPIRWLAPRSPNSFSGKLIKLVWLLRLECTTSGDEISHELQISPHEQSIVLPASQSMKEKLSGAR